jgi:hypothetical protein
MASARFFAGILPAFIIIPNISFSGNVLFIPSPTVQEGARGEFLYVHCAHETLLIRGFSVSLRYDPAQLAISEITTAGTDAAQAEFFNGYHDTAKGQIAYGCVLDMGSDSSLNRTLTPYADHAILRLKADILVKAPALSSVKFVDGLGYHPTPNILVNSLGKPVKPTLRSGSLSVVRPQAGPSRTVKELDEFRLDGSDTLLPAGCSIAWKQLSGPPAQALDGLDTLLPRFLAPAVEGGDGTLVFQLSLGDGDVTDTVKVTVLDMDMRKGTLSLSGDPTSFLIEDGKRAVLFQGDLRWFGPEDITWRGISFHAKGRGDESQLLATARLYLDENDDGRYDGGDRAIGDPATLPEDDGRVSFKFSERIGAGEIQRFYLVFDIAQPTVQAGFLVVPVLLGGVLSLLSRKRARPVAILLLLAIVILPVACGGGGGGGSAGGTGATPADPAPPGESREVLFMLDPSEVSAEGITSGVGIEVEGMPMEGISLEV